MRQRQWRCLVLASLATLLAGSAAPAADPKWLEVTDRPAALAAARKRAAQSASDAIQRGIDCVLAGDFWGADLDLLRANADVVRSQLVPRIRSGKINEKSAFAALMLVLLETPEARSALVTALALDKPEIPLALLKAFPKALGGQDEQQRQVIARFLREDPGFDKAFSRLLESPHKQVVLEALFLARQIGFTLSPERWAALAKRADMIGSHEFYSRLADGELSPAIVDLAVATVPPNQSVAPIGLPAGIPVLEEAMKRGTGPLRRKAREAALRALETEDSEDIRDLLTKIELHSVLAETAELPDLPWLRKQLEQEVQPHLSKLMGSLVRLAPEEGRARIKAALERPKERESALYVVRHAYENSNEEQFSQILARLAQTAPAEHLKSICETLLSINSPSSLREARAILPRLAPTDRAWLAQRLDAPARADIIQRVRGAGVIDGATANKLLAGAAANRSQQAGETSSSLFDVLGEAGILTGFSIDTSVSPVRHDRLLLELAALSQNRFKPLSVWEQWRAPVVEGIDGFYTLQFEHGGRLYTATLRDLGGWYDLERLISVANRALADSAVPQRYQLVDSGGEVAIVVCADPQQLRPLAKEFNLPLLDDPNAPREAGQEFERKVLGPIKPKPR